MTAPECPDCGSSSYRLGLIPLSSLFAGRQVTILNNSPSLYRCASCALAFRWPTMTADLLDELYRNGTEEAWNNDYAQRGDWNIAKGFMQKTLSLNDKVLDIGCFDGKFLSSINDSFVCAGIEINEIAVQSAIKKGIYIVGENISDLDGRYDCITAFDIIEHLHEPKKFISKCFEHINPGGYLIISTGNSESLSFRFMGHLYWYVVVPEHISFLSPSWIKSHANILKYQIFSIHCFSRKPGAIKDKLKEICANIIYKYFPKFFKKLRQIGFGNIDVKVHSDLLDIPPGWGSATDHFIAVLRKL